MSQTVLVLSRKYTLGSAGNEAVRRLLAVWNRGVEAVNRQPEAWRAVLAEKARLPEPIRATYRVNRYPTAQRPSRADVERVLQWMGAKGLLRAPVTYDDLCPPRP